MEIYYSPRAKEDLFHIKKQILETWDDDKLAVKILSQITKAIRNLESFPYMGEQISAVIGVSSDYRCLFSNQNYIFYRVEQDRILIVRILNEKQDYMKVLFGIEKTTE